MDKQKKKSQKTKELPVDPPTLEPAQHVLETWTPLGRALDARIADVMWQSQGGNLLLSGQVPTASHDSGLMGARGAQLLATWCQERQEAGDLPREILLLELGIGTGVHLRGMLRTFQNLCQAQGHDWFARLQVFATDICPGVLELAIKRQVFAGLEDRLHLGLMDLRQPGLFRPYQGEQIVDLRGQIHAAWALYVLDTLPVEVLRHTAEGWEIAAVRTEVTDLPTWQARTGMTLEEGQAALAHLDRQTTLRLAAGQGQTHTQLRMVTFEIGDHPDAGELERAVELQEQALGPGHPLLADGVVLHHPVGAMNVLPRLAEMLAPQGFLLLRDVGLLTAEAAAEARVPQRYGQTQAMPLNFPQLDAWMWRQPAVQWHRPLHDGLRDHATRLLTRTELPQVTGIFAQIFDAPHLDRARVLVEQARAAQEIGPAMEAWRQAALAEPEDWLILQEAAEKALEYGQLELALAIAAHGLELNPVSSGALWRLLGTAHVLLGDAATALRAFQSGLAVAPTDPALHLSMARILAENGDFAQSFQAIGQTLAADRLGAWREPTLTLLDTCLRAEASERARENALQAQRFQ